MADGRKNNGGHSTKGRAGRKPKAEEQRLIERLSPMADLAYTALQSALEEQEPWAVKMWMEYMYGKPKQMIEQEIKQDIKIPKINWLNE